MSRFLQLGVKLAVSLSLVIGLLAVVDGPAALSALERANGWWLATAFLLVNLQTVLSALRWRLTAGPLGLALPRRQAIGEYYLAQFVNQTLPGGVLGDAARAVRTSDAAGALTRAAQAVVIERALGQVALLGVLGLGLVVLALRPDLLGLAELPAAAPVAVLVVLAAAVAIGRRSAARRGGWSGAIRDSVLARGQRARQLALSLAIVAVNLAAFAAAARAVGLALGPLALITLVPMVLAAMLVPLAVAGWGWREGAAAALLPMAGAGVETAVAASLAFGLVVAAASLPGAVREIPSILRNSSQAVAARVERVTISQKRSER